LWPLYLAILLVSAFVLERVFFPPTLEPFQERREMMDTWVSITVYHTDEGRARTAMASAFSRMDEVVSIASVHDPEAEAARLNSEGRISSPSPELVELLSAAKHFFAVSGGVFDVTIEPVVALWRYDAEVETQFWELPPEVQQAAITLAITLTGEDRITVITDPERSITLTPGTKITLGGIAKGYIVDQGLAVLQDVGIEHALIDAGGDIAVIGGKPGGEKWEIALQDPESEEAMAHFALTDGAVATSGNYLRYFDPEAEVGHIVDPRTGYSAHASSSATVIALTCMEADALATAVFVLGPVDGLGLVNGLDAVEAMVLGYENPREIARSQHLGQYETEKKGGV